MKFYCILLLSLCLTSWVEAQKIMKTFSQETCDCIAEKKKQSLVIDAKQVFTECVGELAITHEKQLRKTFGEDFFDIENNNKAFDFGIELGKLLVNSCNHYMDIFIGEAKGKMGDTESFFKQAEQAYADGEYDLAIQYYSQAIALKSNNYQYFNSRGVAYYMEEDYYRAISDFLYSIDINPDFFRPWYNMAYAKFQLNDLNGALTDVEKSIELKPDYCAAHNLQGLIFDQGGDMEQAMESFLNAYHCDTTVGTYAYNIGYALYMQNKYPEASTWMETSVALGYSEGQVMSYLGNAYEAMGDYPKAIEYHTRHLGYNDSTNYIPYFNRAIAYYNSKDYELALKDLLKSYQIDSTDVDIIFNLAKTTDKLGQYAHAEQYCNKALTLAPTNAGFYDLRASIYEKTKRPDLAIRDYTVSISLYPDDCEIYSTLSKLSATGDQQKAQEHRIKSHDLGCERE